jgi:hypothetical protein
LAKACSVLASPLNKNIFVVRLGRSGQAYSLQLTPKPSIDGQFLYEEHDTTFINYLRICFDNCGFSRITNPEYDNDYQSLFDKVKNRN